MIQQLILLPLHDGKLQCTFLLHIIKHQIKNVLNCDMGKYSHGAQWLFCCYMSKRSAVVHCQFYNRVTFQLFPVTSTTQSFCTHSMGLILCSQFAGVQCHFYYTVTLWLLTVTFLHSHFVPVHCHFYYTITLQLFTFTSITQLLSSC